MISFFVKYNKEKLKLALEKIYKVKDIDKMSNDELVVCCMAETIKSLENFCEISESAETELLSRILKIKKALKHADTYDEFKSFCLEGCYDE